MKKVLSFALLVMATSAVAFAGRTGQAVPEIDANTASSAVALLSGAVMLLRRRGR